HKLQKRIRVIELAPVLPESPMTSNDYTRRTTLKRLGTGITTTSLLTSSAVSITGAIDSTAVQPAQDIPIFNPGEDDELVLDDTTEGWTTVESPFFLGSYGQTANTATDTATLWVNSDTGQVGDLTQTVVVGAPFRVDSPEPIPLQIQTEGSYNGTVFIRSSQTRVELLGKIGVGPYSAVRGAGSRQQQDASPTAITETELFHETLTEDFYPFEDPSASAELSYYAAPDDVHFLYCLLQNDLHRGGGYLGSTEVDFSPAFNGSAISDEAEHPAAQDSTTQIDIPRGLTLNQGTLSTTQ
ncbi:hypothetical protein, partial [Natrialba taiwanensis]